MSMRIPHYRQECVANFMLAQPGSINLRQYALEFSDQEQIRQLEERFQKALNKGISFERSEEVADISRQREHEISRALFPYRYVRYGTSIFGSARLAKDDDEFQQVKQISRGLVSESWIDIMTGGGPGIMEAANEGLKEGARKRNAKGKTSRARNTGLLVNLPFEEQPNAHLDIHATHATFGTRLNEFADRSNSSITWDGGGGSDLENAFLFQLKQVGHLEADFPMILRASAWEQIHDQKMRAMYHQRITDRRKTLVSPKDSELVTFVEHPDDAIQLVLDHYTGWKRNVWSKLDDESQQLIMTT